uniref:Uncharacterized protein n=1 Tax=Romanomermis culicivorax TaxID=13658 RepID=A0A915KH58_ROMCU
MIHRNGQFLCVPKADATRSLLDYYSSYIPDQIELELSCYNFFRAVKDSLWDERMFNLIDCNDGISDSLASLDGNSRWPPREIVDLVNGFVHYALQYYGRSGGENNRSRVNIRSIVEKISVNNTTLQEQIGFAAIPKNTYDEQ